MPGHGGSRFLPLGRGTGDHRAFLFKGENMKLKDLISKEFEEEKALVEEAIVEEPAQSHTPPIPDTTGDPAFRIILQAHPDVHAAYEATFDPRAREAMVRAVSSAEVLEAEDAVDEQFHRFKAAVARKDLRGKMGALSNVRAGMAYYKALIVRAGRDAVKGVATS